MSRILLLVIVVLWMSRSSAPPDLRGVMGISQGAAVFLGGLLLVVLFLGLWSRVLARNVSGGNLHRSLQRFHNSMMVARLMIPVWYGIAIFVLGWGDLVARMLGPVNRTPVELPGVLLGTLPAFAAWMALWWAQFPADRALREQSMLFNLEDDLPVHSPPPFWSYFTANLRLQILFILVPIALIILARDIAALLLWVYANIDLRYAAQQGGFAANVELAVHFAAIAAVILFAPEVLRRVLSTERLPDSPLRQRLEAMCRRTGLKYREILLWRTNNLMGNAAVMGLIARLRYILLSDVLIETMTDRQIEAVFAHEVGHVKHWHLGWYVVLVATAMLMIFGPGQLLGDQIDRLARTNPTEAQFFSGAMAVASVGGFLLLFGYLSRRFERQADVYAARTMQELEPEVVIASSPSAESASATISPTTLSPRQTYVGPFGADAFISALHRVAVINNIPIDPPIRTVTGLWSRVRAIVRAFSDLTNDFFHGSIASRMEYLRTMSRDPSRTSWFDWKMSVIYTLMTSVLVMSCAWALVIAYSAHSTGPTLP